MTVTEADFNRRMQDILGSQRTKPWPLSGQEGTDMVPRYRCQTCHDAGVVFSREEDGIEYYRRCDCQELRGMERRLSFAAIPKEFADYTVDSFALGLYRSPEAREKAEMAKLLCQRYVDGFRDIRETGKGLYLFSLAKGSGKTRMAASIANDIITRHRMAARFATALQILDEIRKTWDGRGSGAMGPGRGFLEDIVQVPVLVVDDIGVEKQSPWVNEKLYEIINGRMIQKQVTVFTSNCRMEELPLDERITSRIMKMAVPVPFPEESVRTSLAKAENRDFYNRILGGTV